MATTLTDEQQQAAALIAQGKTNTEIAEAVGVDEATVSQWQQDAHFIAEVNRRRQGVWRSVQDRLRALVPQAVDTFEQALGEGDVKAAVELLKCVGLHGKVSVPTGATDPEIVMVQQAEAWADAELAKEPADDMGLLLRLDRKPELARDRLTEMRAEAN